MAGAPTPISLPNYAGIDFNSILQAVQAAEQVPIAALGQQVAGETAAISQLGTVSGDLTSLQSALTSLQAVSASAPLSASVSSNAPFTAAVTGSPVEGNYSVTVNRLAAAQSSGSQGYASSSDTIGTGTLTITVGGVPNTIDITSQNDTLSGAAAAINSAGIGVTAQVVNTGLPADPYRLILTSNSSGTANAFSVSSSLTGGTAPNFSSSSTGPVSLASVAGTSTPSIGGSYSGALSQGYNFTVTSGGTVGSSAITIAYTSDSGEQGTINVPTGYSAGSPLTVADGLTLSLSAGTLNTNDQFSVAAFNPTITSAQDASLQVGNQVVSSSSNVVTNAIPGVTLSLDTTGGPASVSIGADVQGQSNAIQAFANAYNKLISDLIASTQAQPNQTPPPLAANGALESLQLGLTLDLGNINLSKLGISIDNNVAVGNNGQLTFDSGALSSALQADPTGVANALSQVVSSISGAVNNALDPTTGIISSEKSSYNQLIAQQNSQISDLKQQDQQQQNSLLAEIASVQTQVENYANMAQLFLNTSSSSSGSSSGGLSSVA